MRTHWLFGVAAQHSSQPTGQPQRAGELMGSALRAKLGPEKLEAALGRGAEMDLEQVVEQLLAKG